MDTIHSYVQSDLAHSHEDTLQREVIWMLFQGLLGPILDQVRCTGAYVLASDHLIVYLPAADQLTPASPELRATRALPCRLLALSGEERVLKRRSGPYANTHFHLQHPGFPGRTLTVTLAQPVKCRGARRYKVVSEQEVIACGKPDLYGAVSVVDLGEA